MENLYTKNGNLICNKDKTNLIKCDKCPCGDGCFVDVFCPDADSFSVVVEDASYTCKNTEDADGMTTGCRYSAPCLSINRSVRVRLVAHVESSHMMIIYYDANGNQGSVRNHNYDDDGGVLELDVEFYTDENGSMLIRVNRAYPDNVSYGL